VDYAAENQGVLYVLGVSLVAYARGSSTFIAGCSFRFYGFALAGKIIKSSTPSFTQSLLTSIFMFSINCE
jgi:hypothetical protein